MAPPPILGIIATVLAGLCVIVVAVLVLRRFSIRLFRSRPAAVATGAAAGAMLGVGWAIANSYQMHWRHQLELSSWAVLVGGFFGAVTGIVIAWRSKSLAAHGKAPPG